MIKLFDWLRPASQRQRPESKPAVNDATLARMTESDSVYRALMDHTHALLEEAAVAMIAPKVSAEDRAYLAGRANALFTLIGNIESTRERAREELKRKGQLL